MLMTTLFHAHVKHSMCLIIIQFNETSVPFFVLLFHYNLIRIVLLKGYMSFEKVTIQQKKYAEKILGL